MSYDDWDEMSMNHLVSFVLKYKAYKRTEVLMDQKWLLIHSEFIQHRDLKERFKDTTIKALKAVSEFKICTGM